MSKLNILLFLVPALIWGSTFFVITFQLGKVDPLVSVSYRFFIGGVLLLAYAGIRRLPLKFTRREHLRSAQQGLFLFGVNYWLVYLSEEEISSGLVAVVFSTLIFFNIIFGTIFLKVRINIKTFIGAFVGLIGTVLIYKSEFSTLQATSEYLMATLFCISAVIFASLGNITSAINQKRKMPVIQTVAYGMIYGALSMAAIALLLGKTFTIDTSMPYLLSLSYLTLFGSVIAFTGYLTLVGRIGADKAAYTNIIVPIIAIIIAAIFENYSLDIYAMFGIGLIVFGNFIALARR